MLVGAVSKYFKTYASILFTYCFNIIMLHYLEIKLFWTFYKLALYTLLTFITVWLVKSNVGTAYKTCYYRFGDEISDFINV